jgi:hypothetical protein
MNDLLPPELDVETFGCASQSGYGYSKRPSTYRMPAVKGRPRHRLKDRNAAYEVNVSYNWTQAQFAAWQEFWAVELGYGVKSFIMSLMMDDVTEYLLGEKYLVHMIAPYDASLDGWDNWNVTFTVELPGGFRTNLYQCGDIWGGDGATDDIWGGDISNLATDVIAPCPGVDPNG